MDVDLIIVPVRDIIHNAFFNNLFKYKDAQKLVIMEGKQKVNKTNSSLLGKALWIGTIQELSNKQSLWNKSVCDCYIKGLFRKKIQIIIKDGNIDT